MMNGHRELNKVLNTKDVLVIAFGAMIGWGWVVSSGQWIQTGGVLGTAIAFAIGGIMIFFVGLISATSSHCLTTANIESNTSNKYAPVKNPEMKITNFLISITPFTKKFLLTYLHILLYEYGNILKLPSPNPLSVPICRSYSREPNTVFRN